MSLEQTDLVVPFELTQEGARLCIGIDCAREVHQLAVCGRKVKKGAQISRQ